MSTLIVTPDHTQQIPSHYVKHPSRLHQLHRDYCAIGPYDAVTTAEFLQLGASIQQYLRHPARLRKEYEDKYSGVDVYLKEHK